MFVDDKGCSALCIVNPYSRWWWRVVRYVLLIIIVAAHKETSALLRSTQNIVRRKRHIPVHGVHSTAIIVPNYVRYDAKTSHILISIRVALCMQAEIVHAQSCHLQETRVIDFGRDL